ncbi:PilX N-terminal domain-containing pilus assembly protein [Xanthomonas sp. AM6]|uniref:pilus assembly PilX family protein n=1 Tax=Xanthomonas sp. AM6 TaxID=2982531 RepID=UPI0021D8E550|nr:PilX N-terminal domain-containing pilus assembly protein [Xanthomonas sp. AM6]UYB53885.1 PilX N-terminal domain-containing pilus assembly protein [Xanthomonas sp. AM6]
MSTTPYPAPAARQAGVSLIVVLMLLLVMTLLGLAVVRGTLMQERMSGNLLDRSVNFQAAESALRQGEALALAQTVVPTGNGCSGGVCGLPLANQPERWRDASFGGWVDASTSTRSASASRTQFYIEYMGTAEAWFECNSDEKYTGQPICVRPMYRIVARSQAPGRSSVILQSSYIAP